MDFSHVSVLLNEAVDGLNIKPEGVYVDGTLGGGGHSYEIAARLFGGGRLIGIDQDSEAIEAAGRRLAEFGDRVRLVKSNFENIEAVLDDLGIDRVDGIILDLGVSSHQLDDESRGFTYRVDAPLDMRMDTDAPLTASDIVNGYSEEEIYRIIRDYGEERFASSIARNICRARKISPVNTTGALVDIINQ